MASANSTSNNLSVHEKSPARRTSNRNKSNKEAKEKRHMTLKEDENGFLGLHNPLEKTLQQKESEVQLSQASHDDRGGDNASIHEDQSTVNEDEDNEENQNNKDNKDTGEKENTLKETSTKKPEKLKVENDAILKSLSEMQATIKKMEKAIFDPRNGIEVQLAKTIDKVTDIHTEIHGAVSGIKVRLTKVESSVDTQNQAQQNMETNISRLSKLLDENKRVSEQLSLMQGIIQKFAQQGAATSAKINDLTKRGMEQNVIIYGIEEIKDGKGKENCKLAVLDFLHTFLEIDAEPFDLWKAHRLGYRREGYVRPMVIKTAYHLKESIIENLGKLKGITNQTTGKPLFISEQVPEAIGETKKQVAARLKTVNQANDSLPPDQKKKITVHNDKIIVDGKIQEPDVMTPQPSELFLDLEQQKKVNEINRGLVMTEATDIKHSKFVGLAMHINSIAQVKMAYIAAMQRFPSVDHVMMAYALKEDGQVKFGHCDDGEYGGGLIICKTMASLKAKDTVVFIVRKYGGLHLGLDRFKSIEKVTQDAIALLNM